MWKFVVSPNKIFKRVFQVAGESADLQCIQLGVTFRDSQPSRWPTIPVTWHSLRGVLPCDSFHLSQPGCHRVPWVHSQCSSSESCFFYEQPLQLRGEQWFEASLCEKGTVGLDALLISRIHFRSEKYPEVFDLKCSLSGLCVWDFPHTVLLLSFEGRGLVAFVLVSCALWGCLVNLTLWVGGVTQTAVEYFFFLSVLERIPGRINRTNPVTPSLEH